MQKGLTDGAIKQKNKWKNIERETDFFLDPWTHTQTHIIWLEDKIRISYIYIPIGCSSIHYSFVNDSPHL